jgi:diacylglycerol O-acyltransferase / wax synthase
MTSSNLVSRIRLNNVDLAWLRMENPTNPMMITVTLQFKGQVDHERLISTITPTLGRYRRFRQRIVRPDQIFSRPYWENDPAYRVEDHVERLDLQLPADDDALQVVINQKMNTPLDFAHPLWKVTLVDNHPDGSVLIVRVHHCIADGISLMQVLLQMTETSIEASAPQAASDNPNHDAHQADGVSAIAQPAPQILNRSEVSATISSAQSDELAPIPARSAKYTNPAFTAILAAMARIVFRPPDPPTILKGPLGTIKKAVWSEPFSVPEIKAIAQYKQATINDVMMAVATGAIRRYIELHKDDRKRNIRAFILVNLRGRTLDEELGNKFGLVFLTLPLDREQPLERLEAIKRGMDSLKASAEYAATYIILHILGQMPEWIEHLATRILDTKGTVVATNVPGPRQPIYLAGTPISSIKGWVPQSGRIGVGLSFISYNNQLVVGLNVDAGLLPDPEVFLQLFTEEFRSLQAAPSSDLPG